MPIYSFECRDCGRKGDVHRKVADRGNPVECPCGKEMNRVPERFTADTFEPYYDEGLGSDVYSARDRKAIMNQLGVVEDAVIEVSDAEGRTVSREISGEIPGYD